MSQIIKYIYCPKCEKEYQTKSNLNIHLQNKHNYSKAEAKNYCINLNIITAVELKAKESRKNTNIEKYGVENPFQNKDIQKKIKKTCLEKYGVTNGGASEQSHEKYKNTNMKKYGVKYTWQSEEIKNKIKQTNLELYGVDNPLKSEEIKNKVKQTNLERYGTEWGLGNEEIQKQISKTNIKRYGGVRPSCSKEIVEKQRITSFEKFGGRWFTQTDEHHKCNYQFKDYIFPSGKIIQVQGYENRALDLLVETYNENNIIASDNEIKITLGEIWYKTADGKDHRYYPDIYLKYVHKIIEVKSVYTYYKNKDINELKAKACIDLGYSFEFWIFDPKHDMKLKII